MADLKTVVVKRRTSTIDVFQYTTSGRLKRIKQPSGQTLPELLRKLAEEMESGNKWNTILVAKAGNDLVRLERALRELPFHKHKGGGGGDCPAPTGDPNPKGRLDMETTNGNVLKGQSFTFTAQILMCPGHAISSIRHRLEADPDVLLDPGHGSTTAGATFFTSATSTTPITSGLHSVLFVEPPSTTFDTRGSSGPDEQPTAAIRCGAQVIAGATPQVRYIFVDVYGVVGTGGGSGRSKLSPGVAEHGSLTIVED